MAIKQVTTEHEISEYLDNEIKKREQAIIYNLAYVGEQCIALARSSTKGGKNYQDQTGNLRSSVGYVISVEGRVVQASDFRQVKTGTTGSAEGENFARTIARQYNKGIVLILVAGMNYAAHVANMGYDVLSSAELYAEKTVPTLAKQLGL